jgi:L-alanine-DL-glutamate epimerase-like enolase superfamily enzyme
MGWVIAMNRRSFLKGLSSAGGFLLAANTAPARPLFLIAANEPARISSVEWILYQTGRQQSDNQPEHRCVVRITSMGGIQGWADLAGSAMPDHDTARFIRDILAGRDAGDRDAIWRRLYEQGISLAALAAVDIALWDLLGRVEGKPVHALIGTRRQDVKAYVSTGFNLGDPGKYAEYAVACKEKALHGCKVQPHVDWGAGSGGLPYAGFPDRDMAVYKAVRDAVGPEYPCMADNFCTYTYDQALRVGRLLDDLAYTWYESPMPEDGEWLSRYALLAAEVRTPICAPKTHPDSYPARIAWTTAKACDISCMDVHHGGFTACLELASACEAAGIPLELHDIGPDAYPHLQLIAATPEPLIRYLELAGLSQETRVLPGRATPEPVFDERGRVAIPQTPGMGIELDWRYIFTHKVT